MSVRISESRTPAGFLPSDLGQSAVSPTSNNVVLVSYQSSPIASRRIQRFVLFVTDNVMAAGVGSYEWTFTNGGNTVMTTSIGVAEFTPQNSGVLAVSVVVKNNANASLHTVSMNLQVISLNEGLELKIEQQENNFPGAAHPETSREMINDIRPYVNQLLPVAGNDALNKAICSLIYTRTLQTDAIRRQVRCEELAGLLHTQPNNFFSIAKEGFGLAKTRPQLLAMFLNHPVNAGTKYLNIATLELVASATTQQRNDNTSAIDTAFNALSVQEKIDLFNLLRFPKSHIQCIKTILEGLESRYYSAATLPATLSVVNDAKRLLTEYENGPVAFAAGANPLTASSFSQSVVNLFNHSVWTIPVTPLSGAANNAAAAVPAVAAAVGIPEKVPSHTFVAHHETEAGFGGGSLGFLRKAFLYHDSYALNPQEVRSFEELVDTLSSSNTPINRLRIVSHFGAPSGTNDLNGVGTMFLPFFTGQTLNNANTPHFQTFSEHFKYAISDDEGIKAQFEKNVFPSLVPDFLSSLTMNTATDTTMRTYYQAIFKKLQTNHDASLVPFGLENSGNPSTAVLTIMKWAANLFVLNEPQLPVTMEASFPSAVAPRALPALVKTAMINFINGKLNGLATSAGATTLANIQALSNAFSAQTLNTLNANSFQTPGSFILSSVYLDNHNTLRTQLATVRNRLNNSFVDIRGCRIGQDRTFMQGLRSFFGNPGSEPVIS
ncbi:MAG TPA: hypothetical protein PLP14_07715, partial [Chitinophagaceae bacterium]|nr:hypothetical protein [Chitinophagaceae bacterium]